MEHSMEKILLTFEIGITVSAMVHMRVEISVTDDFLPGTVLMYEHSGCTI